MNIADHLHLCGRNLASQNIAFFFAHYDSDVAATHHIQFTTARTTRTSGHTGDAGKIGSSLFSDKMQVDGVENDLCVGSVAPDHVDVLIRSGEPAKHHRIQR